MMDIKVTFGPSMLTTLRDEAQRVLEGWPWDQDCIMRVFAHFDGERLTDVETVDYKDERSAFYRRQDGTFVNSQTLPSGAEAGSKVFIGALPPKSRRLP